MGSILAQILAHRITRLFEFSCARPNYARRNCFHVTYGCIELTEWAKSQKPEEPPLKTQLSKRIRSKA